MVAELNFTFPLILRISFGGSVCLNYTVIFSFTTRRKMASLMFSKTFEHFYFCYGDKLLLSLSFSTRLHSMLGIGMSVTLLVKENNNLRIIHYSIIIGARHYSVRRRFCRASASRPRVIQNINFPNGVKLR